MRVLIAPDKFKGSLSAREVCDAVSRGILSVYPEAEIHTIPMADGGEGSLDILVDALSLKLIKAKVNDPLFRTISSDYAIKGKQTYIEMAKASGLQLLKENERSALKTSSIGVGELMHHAVSKGAEEIFLMVGGSATNDGGIGMAHGLGFRFFDESDKEIIPIGKNLLKIQKIVEPENLPEFNLTIITDVQNKLLGEKGASYIYGPQKGAGFGDLCMLENGLKHLSRLIYKLNGKNISRVPGSGAAGGIALCGMGLLNGNIKKGIDSLMEIAQIEDALKNTDLVVTGEGKLDKQTLEGKVVDGITKAAERHGVPVLIICGASELSAKRESKLYAREVLKLMQEEITLVFAMKNTSSLIEQRIKDSLEKFEN